MKAISNNLTSLHGNPSLSLDLSRLSYACLSDRQDRQVASLSSDVLSGDAGLNSLHERECLC